MGAADDKWCKKRKASCAQESVSNVHKWKEERGKRNEAIDKQKDDIIPRKLAHRYEV